MHHRSYYTIKGMTLIELMLALMLTLLIVGNLSTLYLAIEKNHLTIAALQNIQENKQIAAALLNSSLRHAGLIGCAKLQNDFPIQSSTGDTITEDNRIQPYHNSEMKPGTESVTVRYVDPISNTLLSNMANQNTLHVGATPKYNTGDILFISDCKTADIFTVQSVTTSRDGTQTITTESSLSHLYAINSEVSTFEINTFYISKTTRKDAQGKSIYALYLKNKTQKTELVEGINDLQIFYDVLEHGSVIEQKAESVTDWSQVVGVSLQLVFDSLDAFSLQKTEYLTIAFRN